MTDAAAAHELRRALAAPEHDSLARGCALVQSVLWALTRDGLPAHILRILNVAVDIAAGDGTSDERLIRAQLRDALDELADAGDTVDVGDGRWLPAATREVDLAHKDGTRLFVGGVPTGSLPPHLQAILTAHGPFRRTQGDAARLELDLPTESLEAWADAPSLPLQAWAEPLLDSPLPPYSEPSDGTRFRFYAPAQARPGASQGSRWVDPPPEGFGRLLVERTRVFGAREYRIAELRRSRIESCGAVLLRGEHRRLMYALDDRAGNPVSAKVMRQADSLMLTLWSEVPRAEQRLFAALGDLQERDDDRYYPRAWRFDLSHADFVEVRLRALGIALKSESRRGP